MEKFWINLSLAPSSNIECAWYDEKKHVLRVKFNNGRIYDYFDVPHAVVIEWTRAHSTGKYFNSEIISYNYKEVLKW